MKKLLIFMFFMLVFQVFMLAQQHEGVVISDNPSDKPHPSAMLDVVSEGKGILIPRISYSMIDNNQIQPLTDGLTVFVIDNDDRKGYWFYNGSNKWVQLRVDLGEIDKTSPPQGSIIMYYGDLTNFDENGLGIDGTEMEGWAICNGNELTGVPDLREKFIVGAGTNGENYPGVFPEEYRQVGFTGKGKEKIMLTEEHIPRHRHMLKTDTKIIASHTHPITDYHDDGAGHAHTYPTKPNYRAKSGNLSRRSGRDVGQIPTSPNFIKIRILEETAFLQFSATEDLVEEFNAGTPNDKNIDNRPSFYVLAYIIRTDLKEKYNNQHSYPEN